MTSMCHLSRSWLMLLLLSSMLFMRLLHATTIDLMLVYDNTATAWVASHGGMTVFSQDVVNRMNQSMQNSGIEVSFRLAHEMTVDYSTTATPSSPLSRDLYALSEGRGAFADVHRARDTYGADLVAMLVDHGSSGGYVGVGWMLTSWYGDSESSYTVNAIRSVEIGDTLTHEVGHNLGADHARGQDSPGPNLYLDGQYSAGWYFTGTDGVDYHTIMAYNFDIYGRRYVGAPLFSTPLKTHQGTIAGDARYADNSRLISETKDIVAEYRQATIDPDPDPDLLPDLVATYVNCDIIGLGVPGNEMDVTVIVENQGSAFAEASLLGFYLSIDSDITLSDLSIGNWVCAVPGLAAGRAYHGCYGTVRLPASMTPGVYYCGVYLDKNEEITESDETNNGAAASEQITIIDLDPGPDDNRDCYLGNHTIVESSLTGTRTIEATETLNTSHLVIVPSGADVTLKSSQQVTLGDGFHAQFGSELQILTGPVVCP